MIFLVVYKPEKSHSVTNALSQLSNPRDPTIIQDQVPDVSLFLFKPIWLHDIHPCPTRLQVTKTKTINEYLANPIIHKTLF